MSFRGDVKALAYPASTLTRSEPVSPCPCFLVFRCDAASRQASLLLFAAVQTLPATQELVLQYNADQLLSGTVSLSSGNNQIPEAQLHGLLRDSANKHIDIKTLALGVEQPCPLWCPDAQTLGPQPGHEAAFRCFVELAKATAVHIVFDYKHVRRDHQGMFKAFSKVARGLTGYPVDGLLTARGLRKASWVALGPVDAIGAPPAYIASRKRPRQGSPNSPGQSPKRVAPHSPAESQSSEKTVPFSPGTAEAVAAALRKTSPAFDYQAEAINAAVSKRLDSVQAEAINAAIARELPTHLAKALHTNAIDAAVSKHLDNALPTLLPAALEVLLAGPSKSSPTTSFTSADSRGNTYRKPPPLTPLAISLLPHLCTHLAAQFQQHQAYQLQRFARLVDKQLDNLSRDAYDARAAETSEMMDELEEYKADLSLLVRDAVRELNEESEAVLARGRQGGLDTADDLAERVWDVWAETCDRIEEARVGVRGLVAQEVRRLRLRRRRGVARRRLLGRKVKTDVEDGEGQWVDATAS